MTAVDEVERFKVRILWTVTGMYAPIITVSIPSDIIDEENMLEGIADLLRERGGCDVEYRAGGLPYVQVKVADMHVKSVRKNGTPPAPAVVKWLVKTLPGHDLLPRPHRLAFEVKWLKPGTRDEIVDVSLSGPVLDRHVKGTT